MASVRLAACYRLIGDVTASSYSGALIPKRKHSHAASAVTLRRTRQTGNSIRAFSCPKLYRRTGSRSIARGLAKTYIELPHPIGNLKPEEMRKVTLRYVDQLVKQLTAQAGNKK